MRFEYGIENSEKFIKIIHINSDGSETKWQKHFTNFLGRRYKTVFADSSYQLTEYDSAGRPVKKTSPAGKIMLTEYDNLGRVFRSVVDMNGNGQIDLTTDRVTEYAYAVTTKNGATVVQRTVKRYQDSSGTPTTLTMGESDVTGLQRWNTAFNRVSSSVTTIDRINAQSTVTNTKPDGSSIVQQYTDGLLVASTHSVLGLSNYYYDEFNRRNKVSHIENGVNQEVLNTFDAMGRILTVTQMPANRVTTNVYDSMGRRTSVTRPGSRTVNYTYSDTGELTVVDGTDTYRQSFTYDGLGRMKYLATRKDLIVPYVPGSTPPLTGVPPVITAWTYSPDRGFMTAKTYNDGKGTAYAYNADGQLSSRIWARGITTAYTYDNAGNPTGIDYSDSTTDIVFTYDQAGRLTVVVDAAGTHTRSYNSESKLENILIPHILNSQYSHYVDYAYDSLGRKSGMQLRFNNLPLRQYQYNYDSMSRLASVGDSTNNTATYTRATGSNMLLNTEIKNTGNTILNRARVYDNANRLTSIINTAGAVTKSYAYTYNDKDQRTKITLADGSYWDYSYDDKGQVTGGVKYDSTGQAIPGYYFGYEFDSIGNRLTADQGMPQMRSVYTSNKLNQYLQKTVPGLIPVTGRASTDAKITVTKDSDNSVYSTTRTGNYFQANIPVDNTSGKVSENLTITAVRFDSAQDKDIVASASRTSIVNKTPQLFTYDDDGNMLTNGDWTYTWNAENRMIAAENNLSAGAARLEFAYDYMGRRFSKKVYTGTTGNWTLSKYLKFVYDGFLQIAEFDGSNDASNTLLKSYCWAGPTTLEWQKDHVNNTYHYSMYDANKNIIGTMDDTQTLTSSYEYAPFGKVLAKTGTYADSNNFRFSSEYHDDETGLVYYIFRYYDADLGRWTSKDPIGEKGGVNLYAMVRNNPVSIWDFLGTTKIEEVLGEFFEPKYAAFWIEVSQPRLWIMLQKDPYTKIVKSWVAVQQEMNSVKSMVAKEPYAWKINHKTSRSWKPHKGYGYDSNAFKIRVRNPIGTDPNTCKREIKDYILSGVSSVLLHRSAIGSFELYVTVDKADRCRAKLNVWMYNNMDQRSFGDYAPYFKYLTPAPMKDQYMWWNWKEDIEYDSKGNYKNIASGSGGGAKGGSEGGW
jgi:RHS repeat-associated protein